MFAMKNRRRDMVIGAVIGFSLLAIVIIVSDAYTKPKTFAQGILDGYKLAEDYEKRRAEEAHSYEAGERAGQRKYWNEHYRDRKMPTIRRF